jgi:WD40 repeat protein
VFVEGKTDVQVVDWRSREARTPIPGGEEIWGAGIAPDASRIAVAANPDAHDKLVVLESRTGKQLWSVPCNSFPCFIAFSPDASRLLVTEAAGIEGGYVLRLRDPSTGKQLVDTLHSRFGPFTSRGEKPAVFSPDGRRLAVLDKPLFTVYDVATGKEVFRAKSDLSAEMSYCDGVAYASSGRRIVTLGGRVCQWDGDTGEATGPEMIMSLGPWALSRDGNFLVGGQDPTTRDARNLWDLRTGRKLCTFNEGDAKAVAISPDGKRAATTDSKLGDTLIWDISE